MNSRQANFRQLISRARGVPDADEYLKFKLENPSKLLESARTLMERVPPSFGACVLLSAAWAGLLRDQYQIPAIVVAGDLKISGTRIFKYKEKLPQPTKAGRVINMSWSGHCWIEVDGFLGDLSIFRTAYATTGPSALREFVVDNFGFGRGGLISPVDGLPPGLKYVPQEVMSERQMEMFIASLGYKIENNL